MKVWADRPTKVQIYLKVLKHLSKPDASKALPQKRKLSKTSMCLFQQCIFHILCIFKYASRLFCTIYSKIKSCTSFGASAVKLHLQTLITQKEKVPTVHNVQTPCLELQLHEYLQLQFLNLPMQVKTPAILVQRRQVQHEFLIHRTDVFQSSVPHFVSYGCAGCFLSLFCNVSTRWVSSGSRDRQKLVLNLCYSPSVLHILLISLIVSILLVLHMLFLIFLFLSALVVLLRAVFLLFILAFLF